MTAEPSTRSPYEVLGISPGASIVLARELYWKKIGEQMEAERQGDPGARQSIQELNQALASVLADHGGVVAPASAPRRERQAAPRRSTAAPVVTLLVGAALTVLAWVAIAPIVGIAIGVASMAVVALITRRTAPDRRHLWDPLPALQLGADATVEEIHIAYQVIAQVLLGRVRTNPEALRELTVLDEAYAVALVRASGGEVSVPGPAGPSAAGRSLGQAGGAAASAGRAGASATASGLVGVGRALASMGLWLRRQVSGAEAPSPEVQRDELAEAVGQVQLDRRLQVGFRNTATQLAMGTSHATDATTEAGVTIREEGATAAPAGAGQTAFLALTGGSGTRRVPLGGMPVRIGSDDSCDVVLHDEAVLDEHALIWWRDDLLLLHALDPAEPCLVNARPTSWATLENGDVLQIGSTVMRIEINE